MVWWIRLDYYQASIIKRVRSCHRIPRTSCFFILKLDNILRSDLNCSTSYGRSTHLKPLIGLLLVSFICLGEKNSLKCLLIGGQGGRLSPHVQTVSTSVMSKLVKYFFVKFSNPEKVRIFCSTQ